MSLVTKLLAIIKQKGRDLKIMSVFKPSCDEYNQRVQVERTMYSLQKTILGGSLQNQLEGNPPTD